MRIRKSDLKSLIREVVEECLILNEGSIADLERQVVSLHKKYLTLARAK